MKRLFVLVLGMGLVLCFQGNVFSADKYKIGVVDMQRFQEKSIAFQKVRERLRGKYESLQKKLEAEQQELLKIEEDFKKQSMMLSLDAKEDKKREMEKKKRHYKYIYEEYSQELKAAEEEMRRSVAKEVGKVVEEIGQKDNYIIILERRTLGLIFYKDEIDITDQVIAAYDRTRQ
jgi:outer membrane protein